MALMSCLALPITLCGVTLFEGVFSLEVPHILREKIPDSNRKFGDARKPHNPWFTTVTYCKLKQQIIGCTGRYCKDINDVQMTNTRKAPCLHWGPGGRQAHWASLHELIAAAKQDTTTRLCHPRADSVPFEAPPSPSTPTSTMVLDGDVDAACYHKLAKLSCTLLGAPVFPHAPVAIPVPSILATHGTSLYIIKDLQAQYDYQQAGPERFLFLHQQKSSRTFSTTRKVGENNLLRACQAVRRSPAKSWGRNEDAERMFWRDWQDQCNDVEPGEAGDGENRGFEDGGDGRQAAWHKPKLRIHNSIGGVPTPRIESN
ncbi:hypothetical protein GGX14DRAFT_394075 [Mycena pura]|uniref:Uncharacterized protein n=1 Tax=Mycena pura TaxID=153505 RepID=A0AAD6VJH8_9AGAR|nr:hypothetical protein GGX14DRAFT_394075 [Mycena pura]